MPKSNQSPDRARWDFVGGMALAPVLITVVGLLVLVVTAVLARSSVTAAWVAATATAAIACSMIGLYIGRYRSVSKQLVRGVVAVPLLLTAAFVLLAVSDFASYRSLAWLAVLGPSLLLGLRLGRRQSGDDQAFEAPA